MPQETLKSAARRAVRFFDIDMNAGGLITSDTELAMLTLRKMIEKSPEYDLLEKLSHDAIARRIVDGN